MPTKRSNGEGSIKKVTRNGYEYWCCRYTTGKDIGTGKQIQKSKYFKTQKEAREYLQKVSVEVNNGSYLEPTKITLAQWIDIWLEEYCVDLKHLALKGYKSQCENHIKPELGAVKLSDLKTPQIQTFYNKLAKEGKTVRSKDEDGNVTITYEPLATKSVQNIHRILSKCLNTAVEIEYLKTNPASKAKIKKVTRKEIKPLNDEQVKLFLKEVGSDKYSCILKTILFTGMRESEAIGLTWDSVDFKTGTIKIEKQLQHWTQENGGYTVTPTKNNKSRTVKPAKFVMDMLKDQRTKQQEEMLACPNDIWESFKTIQEQKTALCFTDERGHHLSQKSLYKHYKKIAGSIGAGETCVHDLRHTFAVLSLQNGDDYKTVQENLGHATAAFTLDIYGHVSEKMKEESSDRMQKYISGLNG